MEEIQFKINGKQYSVGSNVESYLTLVEFIRRRANLLGTKYMCLEAGCGACIVTAVKSPGATPVSVNACMVSVLSCHNWEITTIEKLGNKLDGYHPIQETLAKHNGTQCGHCSPGWVMSMYSLMEGKKDLTMHEIEKSFGSNICRCTGYRPILDAFKSFGTDAPKSKDINDIEDLVICKKDGSVCNKKKCHKEDSDDDDDDDDWCVVSDAEAKSHDVDIFVLPVPEIPLLDGKSWFRAKTTWDIFNIFLRKGTNSYMLVAGNTSKAIFPVDEYPQVLIDISDVDELKGYRIDQNLVIGSGTTLAELMSIFENISQSEANFSYLKTLNEHLNLVAHIAVRNLGTIAGNLMMKHQYNSFLSDLFLLLTTIGARITIVYNIIGRQVVTMEQFLKINMKGKIIWNILLPPFNKDYKIVTYKIMARAQNAKAIVNAGFLYKYNDTDHKITEARIVYGGTSPSFVRAKSTENSLIGKNLFTDETLQSTLRLLDAEIVAEESLYLLSAAYRKKLALALFYKSLLSLAPTDIINPRYRSGSVRLDISTRPVSKAQHDYPTIPSMYPLTEPVPKLEGLLQCAGEATYAEDQPTFAHEVFAALVLSTVPTGTIISIDPSEALKQPGAVAFFCAKDIPGLNSFTAANDVFGGNYEEVFCSSEVRYFNQPIGVIAAESKTIAERIAKMVKVEYSHVEKPVVDVKEAKKDPKRINVFDKYEATDKGSDVSKVIKGSDTFRAQCHFTMENIVMISRPTEEGLEMHVTSQWIDGLHEPVAKALNINQNRIDCYVRRIGGGFGLKISRANLSAVACGLVSLKLNRPCRLIMPFNHITRALGKRMPCATEYEVAVNSKGVIQYLNLDMYEDNGFFFNEKLQLLAMESYDNVYNSKTWNYNSISTFTDTAKNSWCRAPGNLENVAAIEAIMERISYEMSIDPIDVRLANMNPKWQDDMVEVIDTLKQSSDYEARRYEIMHFNQENRWKKRGIGVCLMRFPGDTPRVFEVNLSAFHGDGSLIITHGGIEMGQGINTKVIQICAYLLGVPLDKIQVKPNNTIIGPNCATSGGSLTTQFVTLGAQKCCEELLKRIQPAKEQLTNPTWGEIIQKAFSMDIDLQVHGYVGAQDILDVQVFGMTIAEVEIDVLTGERQVLRVDILEDVGLSPSPELDLGQIEGAFVMGMGYWLTEHLIYNPNNGELLTNRPWDLHVPQAMDIPQDFRVSFRKNSYSTKKILGSKFAGEPAICMATAIPHAIRQALASARLDCGIPISSYFEIDGTYTLEAVCMTAASNITEYKFS